MKKFRVCGPEMGPDCQSTLSTAIRTATGLEEAHINMDTGEITYGPATCAAKEIDERKLRQAVRDAGYDLEEMK